jgi:hypothetical protein
VVFVLSRKSPGESGNLHDISGSHGGEYEVIVFWDIALHSVAEVRVSFL